jgi:hypothetical protein
MCCPQHLSERTLRRRADGLLGADFVAKVPNCRVLIFPPQDNPIDIASITFQCKKTFATKSANCGLMHRSKEDASYLAPPAQIRTCSFPAYGSYLESLTAMLRLGQGWRIRGRGSHSFISLVI